MQKLRFQLLSALCVLWVVNANAAVDDPDYFNLYPGGDGTSVSVCGVAGCDATSDMIVSTISITPAGSGVRDTFLRVQAPGNDTTETAYNTDLYPLQEDGDYRNGAKDTTAGNDDTFNNAVLISDLLILEQGGIEYYQILLDVNENGSGNEFIRLDEFEIHTSSTGYVGEFPGFDATANGSFDIDDPSGLAAGTTRKVFDMDYWDTKLPASQRYGGTILSSLQDGGGRNGSGDEDYSFLIPVSLFNPGENYLHVAATFGCVVDGHPNKSQCEGADNNDPTARANAGFEEFAAVLGPNPDGDFDVPVPGTALLLGLGLMLVARRHRLTA